MNIRNWVKFYFTTLLIGGIVTVITGFVVSWDEYKGYFATFDFLEISLNGLWFLGVGLIFATLSQMGFFAYLTVHRFGIGLFKSLWNPVQVLLIAFVIFDLVYFRYAAFAEEGESVLSYVLIALFLLLISLVIGYLKAEQLKNKSTFISAVFFMVVVTVIEWVPVLRINEQSWLHLMLYPLLICNAYQLLSLPKYIERSNKERTELKARKEAAAKTQ